MNRIDMTTLVLKVGLVIWSLSACVWFVAGVLVLLKLFYK